MQKKPIHFHLQHWHKVAAYLMACDAFSIVFSWVAATWFRFDFHFTPMMSEFGPALLRFLLLYTVAALAIYYAFRLYHSIWQFASYNEMVRITGATAACTIAAILLSVLAGIRLPVSVYIGGLVFQFIFCSGLRFSYRFVLLLRDTRRSSRNLRRNAMIIGAGQAGQFLERDVRNAKESDMEVCCFIDDNPNKHNRTIDKIPVVGGRDEILNAVEAFKIEVILFAIPSATAIQKRDILTICQEANCEIRVLPSLISLANGQYQVELNSLQHIKMEDFLGREQVQVDTDEILNSITGKVVMITGGGGSIGSELCRQIAAHKPGKLIIVDVYENNAYDIQQELIRTCPNLNLKVIIASVRDSARINQIFETYRPQIVYHAAAHKHVPLMETSPCEAVKNNVFGTYKTARAALEYGAEKFVLISTDKAVNPTNIMGATKRICEMIIQSLDTEARSGTQWQIPKLHSRYDLSNPAEREKGHTQFVAVRFGNVLGSNGSVIPLFKKQIESGGPVTVTHPDIIRYFMTIQEAVSLILEAGTYAKGGEIFVLDMGEPVKIDDLAKNMIRMAGKVPGRDIQIDYTGLRPGEKMYEEKLMAEEGMARTKNRLIHIGKPIEFNMNYFLNSLPRLYEMAMDNQDGELIELVADLVGTYTPDWTHFRKEGIQEPEVTGHPVA